MKKVLQFSLVILILIAAKRNVGQHENDDSFAVRNNFKTDSSTQKTNSFNEKAVDIFVSSNLPIVIIDTKNQNIRNVERIIANMGIIYNQDKKRNYLWHPHNNYDGLISIEVRGWSSIQYPKKQYGFETQTYWGENLNVSLLDLPPENDWILYAPYSDKSLMRNVLAYKLARDMGRYASRTVFCDLVLNDQYWGVYVLMEKIKRDNYRVNISRLNPDEISGADLTGGYIIKLDKTTDADVEGWRSSYPPNLDISRRICYLYHYPKPLEIVDQQKEYIQNYIHEFETIMYGPDFADPDNGYSAYIDVDSFVDFFIINELGKNVDAYRLSTFMYKDKGGKLTMGPIWDFNLAFGNASYHNGQTTSGWMVDHPSTYGFYRTPFWWPKLKTDNNFMYKVHRRWRELRNKKFEMDTLCNYIDSVAVYLNEAQIRNFRKWKILGKHVWPNTFIGKTYQQEVSQLKRWLTGRIEWMDENILENFSTVIWTPPDEVNCTGLVGVERAIAVTDFVRDSVNIDSVVFSSNNDNLQLIQDVDSLRLTAFHNDVFKFVGSAYNDERVISTSMYTYTTLSTEISFQKKAQPNEFSLHQNYPNPFNLQTTIKYNLPVSAKVTLKIYNLEGQKIQTLINEEQSSGHYSIVWNGKDFSGLVGSGVYFYQLTTDKGFTQSKKIMLLK